MKNIILFFFLIFGFSFSIDAQTISENEAKEYAMQWFDYINGTKSNIQNNIKIGKMVDKEMDSTFIYNVNFEGGGFVLISSEQGINPIFGYSRTGVFEEEKLSLGDKIWIECALNHLKTVKEKNDRFGNAVKYDMESYMKKSALRSASIPSSIPSLFETYQTSRWAFWDPYDSAFPFTTNGNICVPLAMAQIVKFHQYPMQGSGGYGGVDFSRQFYNYSEMPFRLTYCGNSANGGICDDGTFNIISGVTVNHIKNVSTLIYHLGVMVNTNSAGTSGTPFNWVDKLVLYFNYSNYFNYRDEFYISNNKNAFKEELRNEIFDNRPVLFAYYNSSWGAGHAVVIDGYENNDYFHFAIGRGGSEDLYYYLFDLDDDGVHLGSPQRAYYRAATGIKPICPNASDLNINNISFSDSKRYEATNSVVLNTVSVLNGGRIAIQAGSFIQMNSGFEIQSGAEGVFIVKECGFP